jgi:nucleoside-diphosphate-sugar epimerase
MNVLVVGGAGYLGGAVTDCLIRTRRICRLDIRVVDALLYDDVYRKPGVEFARVDVRDANAMAEHLDWAHVIVWLAAIVGDEACLVDPCATYTINYVATRSAALRSSECRSTKFIFASSCSVYGAQSGICTESSPSVPISEYARLKCDAERAVLWHAHLPCVFRFGTLFGVADDFSRFRTDLVVNNFVVSAYHNRWIGLRGGSQNRPFIHVTTAAKYIVQACVGGQTGLYNCTEFNARIRDIATAVRDRLPTTIINDSDETADERDYKVSNSRLLSDFERCGDDGMDLEDILSLLESGRIGYPSSLNSRNHAWLTMHPERLAYHAK